MACYDCIQENRPDTVGIGICTRCGLATCHDHARVLAVHVQRANGMSRTTGPRTARRVVCHTCHAAETAH
ncbi:MULTISPECIES: DUF2180 family protein [Streptomyces]|uniref:DUF2180 family protein n=1 Tax=Streptomyces TaxID=1883 RepID=UPI00210D7D0B|nr:DUF2180 family protein [Streptomyces longispororuber]MCQ4210664.1 DUF2180 family protein [Streptomyces longispororuber]